MAETKRGPILGYVGGIGVANEAYSGNLAEMTVDQLRTRLRQLEDSPNPDTDVGFEAKMVEMEAIREELKKKGYVEHMVDSQPRKEGEDEPTIWECVTGIWELAIWPFLTRPFKKSQRH